MRILIAGGCGFVGSSLAIYLKTKYPHYKIIVYDNLIRKGSELNLLRLKDLDISIIKGDVCDQAKIRSVPEMDVIIDAAAEPSVLAGINESPKYVIDTNFGGTINLAEAARQWGSLLVFLSTSRIYPFDRLNAIPYRTLESRFEFEERTPRIISPRGINETFSVDGVKSFYGASKFAAENFLKEYGSFHGLNSIINRFGVISGPFQMGKIDQGILVHWLSAHFWKKPINYLGFGGEGKQVRDILHCEDACRLIDIQIHDSTKYLGEIWNVGGGRNNSISLKELTSYCEEITGQQINIGSIPETRQADVRIYYTDNSKIEKASGWSPEKSIGKCIEDTYGWLEADHERLRNILGQT